MQHTYVPVFGGNKKYAGFIGNNFTSCFHEFFTYLFLFFALQVNGRDVSQSSHEEAVAAFLTASEPITVEVLRRPEATAPNFGGKIQTGTSVSVPVSHRNSIYIPQAKSPSPSMNLHRVGEPQTPRSGVPEVSVVEVQSHDLGGQNGGQIGGQNGLDHDFEEDEEMSAGNEDLLVPGLDYEVSFLEQKNAKYFAFRIIGAINAKLLSNCWNRNSSGWYLYLAREPFPFECVNLTKKKF